MTRSFDLALIMGSTPVTMPDVSPGSVGEVLAVADVVDGTIQLDWDAPGGLQDAISDGKLYGRRNAAWTEVVIPATDWGSISGKPSEYPSSWSLVSGKPSTFPPIAHQHPQSDITNLTTDLTALTTAVAGKEPLIAPGTSVQYWAGDKTWKAFPAPPPSVGLVDVSDTAPASPVDRQLWWQSSTGILALRFNDGTGPSQWVQVNLSGSMGATVGDYMPMTGGTLTGNLTIGKDIPQLFLNYTGSTAPAAYLCVQKGGLDRWVFSFGGAESTGNAGNNFQLSRYDDAGAFLSSPIAINRATGAVSLMNGIAGNLTVGGPLIVSAGGFNVTGTSVLTGNMTINTGNLSLNGTLIMGATNSINCQAIYNNTSGSPATVGISAGGTFYRSTASSAAIKDAIEPLWDAIGDKVLSLKPLFYRYKIKTLDPEGWSWYGFTAENAAEIDPRFAQWDETSPQGINWNSIVTALVNLVQRQERRIAALEAR